jgi:glutaminyl-tRNA synthetase
LNWISADESFDCEARVYGLLFTVEKPANEKNFMEFLNKDSKKVYKNVRCHKDLLTGLKVLDKFQFERKGYFVVDKDSDIEKGKIVWNKIVDTQDNKTKK